ncbi:CapA family protein [Oceanobacillus halophilus]|uniref:CapA family protein n=1 Tax=Oceanobacillus halophilus TaxID=930130 RepID=A0A495A4Y1_9BACI|nr:CapA family protein [Oceanobacillus halophilus]RKQ34749.1 CapA family protein [Oceanobacillus halophilus]
MVIRTIPVLLCFSFFLSHQPYQHPIIENAQFALTPNLLATTSNFSREDLSAVMNDVVNYENSLTISAAGDVTIGSDDSFGYYGTFHHEVDQSGLEHFGRNVAPIFDEDDLTIVNLETTLTDSTNKADKTFRFAGKPSYTEILNLSSIEAVNLANNHTFDYLQRGYEDTVANLDKHNISSFGYEQLFLEELNGITVGAAGYKGWNDSAELREQIEHDVNTLQEQGAQVVIANFHWGEERHYHPNASQQSLGRYAIDAGADLVLGHHPHVVQGIEEYNGKYIVYSLGNFMFGGNRNPDDKDTFIFQQTFHFAFDELLEKKDIKIIPTSISSVADRNNYQPTPLTGKEANRVLNKILTLSDDIPENDIAYKDYSMDESIAVFSEMETSSQ